ncbi:MAG: hypothetical protein Harvfovirus14_16 [Harvfovirus sp.]|uniref:Uncharacterized protein n=1 Tax=Harvfovirus sp. TaxID=2487768 RepID=A0A3G5A1F4_9VIRU|nr:MAG: hypothetical protein Harvfovirus14_16 [Harvfovirus sp.]
MDDNQLRHDDWITMLRFRIFNRDTLTVNIHSWCVGIPWGPGPTIPPSTVVGTLKTWVPPTYYNPGGIIYTEDGNRRVWGWNRGCYAKYGMCQIGNGNLTYWFHHDQRMHREDAPSIGDQWWLCGVQIPNARIARDLIDGKKCRVIAWDVEYEPVWGFTRPDAYKSCRAFMVQIYMTADKVMRTSHNHRIKHITEYEKTMPIGDAHQYGVGIGDYTYPRPKGKYMIEPIMSHVHDNMFQPLIQ